jgi:hypothetical protein
MICKTCEREVEWVARWWCDAIVLCDIEPDEATRESFVEVEPEVFVSVFRHLCIPREPTDKYKPLHVVHKGKGSLADARVRLFNHHR